MSIIVGVGVFVRRGTSVLVGKRLNSHGAGTWSLPGGRVEFGESYIETAARELKEETGIDVTHLVPAAQRAPLTVTLTGEATFRPATNATSPAGAPFEAAAVTVFCPEERAHMVVRLVVVDAPADVTPVVTEQDKCESWHWVPWDDIRSLSRTRFASPLSTDAIAVTAATFVDGETAPVTVCDGVDTAAARDAAVKLGPDGELLRGGKVFAPMLAVALSDWNPTLAIAGEMIRTI